MRLFTFTRMVSTVLLTAAVTTLAAGVGAGAAQAAPIISHEAILIAGTSTAEVTVHSGASTSGKPMSVLILNDRGNLASPSRTDIVYLGEVRVGEGGTSALRVALPSATLDGFAIALNTGDGRYLAPLNPSGTLPGPGETPGTGGETPGTGEETPGTGGSEHPVGPGAGGNVQPTPGGGAASSSGSAKPGSAKPGSAKPSQKTKPSQTSTLPWNLGADEGAADGSSQDSPGEEMTPTPTAPATPQADDPTTSDAADAATDAHQATDIAWPWFVVGGVLLAAIAALAYLLFVRRRSSTEN